jgi:hypothetical protein
MQAAVAVERVVVHTDYVLPYAAAEVDDVVDVDEVAYDTHTDSVDDTQLRQHWHSHQDVEIQLG